MSRPYFSTSSRHDLIDILAALAQVNDPNVKLRLPVGMIRLDLDGDGEAGPSETFWKVFATVAWRAAKLSGEQQEFPIGFDAADAHWTIGYTHLLWAMAEACLAHDTKEFYPDPPRPGKGSDCYRKVENRQGSNGASEWPVAIAELRRFV